MNCSLPVISLLTCCQKGELEAYTSLYSQSAMHSGKVHPFPILARTLCPPSDIGTTAVYGKESKLELPSCVLLELS